MIEITRRVAAQFRAAARRCVCHRPKGLSPPVVLEAGEQGVTLFAAVNGVGVSLSVPKPRQSPERLIVPIEVLQAVEGNRDDPVSFVSAGNRVCCRWTDRGVAVEKTFNTVTPDGSQDPWPMPTEMRPVDASVLHALHECGKTTAQENTRYAMTNLHVRGREGKVTGTDGRQLLVWNGFSFPFAEQFLVPAVPIFGSRDVAQQEEVSIGRTGRLELTAEARKLCWQLLGPPPEHPDFKKTMRAKAEAERKVEEPEPEPEEPGEHAKKARKTKPKSRSG